MATEPDNKPSLSLVKIDKADPQATVDAIRAMAKKFCRAEETPEDEAEFEAELAKFKAELENGTWGQSGNQKGDDPA